MIAISCSTEMVQFFDSSLTVFGLGKPMDRWCSWNWVHGPNTTYLSGDVVRDSGPAIGAYSTAAPSPKKNEDVRTRSARLAMSVVVGVAGTCHT
jgi:hypothetical protein